MDLENESGFDVLQIQPLPRFVAENQDAKRLSVKRMPRRPDKYTLKIQQTLFSQEALSVDIYEDGIPSPTLSPKYKATIHLPYLYQCFRYVGLLGEGSSGEVFKGLSIDDGKWYAIKKYKDRYRSHVHRGILVGEVLKYAKIPHNKYCVELVKAWEEYGHLYVQMEMCNGSLNDYVHVHQSNVLDENCLWNILLDLLLGLQMLHSRDLLHLDIKPDNILVSQEETFKLGDFGLLFDISKGPVEDALEGDSKYLAPEVLNGQFSKAADVFSMGISMLEITANIELPNSGPQWHTLRQGKLPRELMLCHSDELFDVIKRMMSPIHSDRPRVEELLLHGKLRKLKRSRYIQGMMHTMKRTIASFLQYGLAVVTNYGLGIFNPMIPLQNMPTMERWNSRDSLVPCLDESSERTPKKSPSISPMWSREPSVSSTLEVSTSMTECRRRIFDDRNVTENEQVSSHETSSPRSSESLQHFERKKRKRSQTGPSIAKRGRRH